MNPDIYLMIARDVIKSNFDKSCIDKKNLLLHHPELQENKATFVTLTINGHLRGCIGSIIAHQSFIDDLISNAQSAAFHDPRFPPLCEEELASIKIEVSILTHPKSVIYDNRDDLSQLIRPKIDGIIIRLGNRQATFLPQVWEELSDFDLFFSNLGQKAGIGTNPLLYHPEIYTYQVEKFKEI
ncbi:MAG: AmmeMemoRadiSam system protein A [Sulfuricurvum sp.]|nr:AmmeMemoRadiSam system protein A [Sulfuricurvum sp.]